MTAPIVLYGTKQVRTFFPDHRFDGDQMQPSYLQRASHGHRDSLGQLWTRVAEGRKQVWS